MPFWLVGSKYGRRILHNKEVAVLLCHPSGIINKKANVIEERKKASSTKETEGQRQHENIPVCVCAHAPVKRIKTNFSYKL